MITNNRSRFVGWSRGIVFVLALAVALAGGLSCAEGGKPAGPTPAAKAAIAAPAARPASRPATRPALKIDRFEPAIQAYEKKDQAARPAPGGTVFIGSSTFAMWKDLEKDFAEFRAVNRGFGGSTIPEVIHYAPRILLPYKPARIVFYCGENDVAMGASVKEVVASFQQFLDLVHKELPDAHVYYLPMKTSASRLKYADDFEEIRYVTQQLARCTPWLHYVDIASPLVKDGQPIEEYYLKDRLHLNRQGYERIIPVIKAALK